MLLGVRGVEIERDILAFLIELSSSCGCQALRQGGLTFELMRELTPRKHCLRVGACGAAQARIQCEQRRAGLRSGLVCQIQKLMLSLGIVVAERNIGRGRRSGL